MKQLIIGQNSQALDNEQAVECIIFYILYRLCSWISFEKQEIGCSFSVSTSLSSLSPSTSPSKEE